jgi:hypothetical protein
MGWLSIINSVTNISRLGTFKVFQNEVPKISSLRGIVGGGGEFSKGFQIFDQLVLNTKTTLLEILIQIFHSMYAVSIRVQSTEHSCEIPGHRRRYEVKLSSLGRSYQILRTLSLYTNITEEPHLLLFSG